MGHAIFFNGAIGAGKSTLGRAVAAKLGAAFLEGDDFLDPNLPWYAASLSASRGIANAALAALAASPVVIVAYPLRCTNYIYFRRRIIDAGHEPVFLTLRASLAATLQPQRGRAFSAEEADRIEEMIAQGYDSRPFSDATIRTDAAGFDATAEAILGELRSLIITA